MQVNAVDNVSFNGVKHSFLNKAKNSSSPMAKAYYKSLHNEAMARLEYMKFKKVDSELDDIPNDFSIDNILKAVKTLLKLGNHKLNSVDYQTKAYSKFPERFMEPDNSFNSPHRYYRLSKAYPMPWEK